MSILTVPHPTLRQITTEVTDIDSKLHATLAELEHNLVGHDRGVGLAAVQVNVPVRVFSTYLSKDGDRDEDRIFRLFINPVLVKTYGKSELGGDGDSTPLEGCLSIPLYYGPVPRFFKLKLEYSTLENSTLVTHQEEFSDFAARVVQHELDHLDGVLFTDYSLEYDLPLYKENDTTKKLEELSDHERSMFEMI